MKMSCEVRGALARERKTMASKARGKRRSIESPGHPGAERSTAPDRSILFVISGIITKGTIDWRTLVNPFEQEIASRLEDVKIKSPLPAILMRPIIMDPAIAPPFQDFVTHRRDGEVHV